MSLSGFETTNIYTEVTGSYQYTKGVSRGGATGWAGWAFAHPIFKRSGAKNP